MAVPRKEAITQLLIQYGNGDRAALDRIIPHVYATLRDLAHRELGKEHVRKAALNTTALVHEAYLRLVLAEEVSFANRAHFFAIAARQMRQVLVDDARHRKAQKRGGGAPLLPLDESNPLPAQAPDDQLLALDERLEQLGRADPEAATVVDLLHFGGLTLEECGAVLGVSVSTVRRRWTKAKAWLALRLGSDLR